MRTAWMLVPLTGCLGMFGDDGTQTGTEVPDHCEESGRTAVDPDVVDPDLGFAPSELVDGLSGAWTGTYAPIQGEASDVAWGVALGSGDVEVVQYTLVTRVVDDVSEGAPDAPSDCPARLSVPLAATLHTADGGFDEAVSGALVSTSPTDGTFTASVPLAAVEGTARPTAFGPDDWPQEALVVDTVFDGAWSGSLTWQGWTDEPTEDVDTGGIGTVEPSGETEMAGTFTATR